MQATPFVFQSGETSPSRIITAIRSDGAHFKMSWKVEWPTHNARGQFDCFLNAENPFWDAAQITLQWMNDDEDIKHFDIEKFWEKFLDECNRCRLMYISKTIVAPPSRDLEK